MWRIYGGAITVVAGIAAMIEANSHKGYYTGIYSHGTDTLAVTRASWA
jgi:hypothetical protein